MTQLFEYTQRLAPGLALGIGLLVLLQRAHPGARLCLYLALFVFVRDAMTPAGLWKIDAAPVYWLRLPADPTVLIALAATMAAFTSAMFRFEPALARQVVWVRGRVLSAAAVGCISAVLIAVPVALIAHGTPLELRGGAVPASQLFVLLVFCLVGNTCEEVLFRGFLQGLMTEQLGAAAAVLVAGLSFAFGHVFLAATVTNIGWPILAFTAYEGLICASLSRRFGLLASVFAHGGGIFLVASGMG